MMKTPQAKSLKTKVKRPETKQGAKLRVNLCFRGKKLNFLNFSMVKTPKAKRLKLKTP